MSGEETLETLAVYIAWAKSGDEVATDLLRRLVRSCADSAPVPDLIRICQFLHDLRREALLQDIDAN